MGAFLYSWRVLSLPDTILDSMSKNQRLIVFFIPHEKIINGGVLSIFSICKESRRFKAIHGADVILSVPPGYKSYVKNDLFKNDELIHSFDEIAKKTPPQSLILHVPEYAANEIYRNLKGHHLAFLRAVPELHVNIMNQNILYMPKPSMAADWFSLTSNITQTTAHDRYATQETANTYNIPTHHLSVFNDPRQYTTVPFEHKKDRIVLSPDMTDKKEKIVVKLQQTFPTYEFVTIQNMTYEQYKKTIREAKFAVTFGEGFDGYFIEAFFSGGITFAVYNEDFFPDKGFAKFDNLYSGYDDMLKRLPGDMERLATDKRAYDKIVKQNFDKIVKLYDFSVYLDNLKQFYQGKYTFRPESGSAERLIAEIIDQKEVAIADQERTIHEHEATIAQRDKLIREKDSQIHQNQTAIHERDIVIEGMVRSASWQLTRPLRSLHAAAKRSKNKS